MEGLLKNDTNIHAGIRTTLSGPSDYDNDGYCGFEIVEAREIDVIGRHTQVIVAIQFMLMRACHYRNGRHYQEDSRSCWD